MKKLMILLLVAIMAAGGLMAQDAGTEPAAVDQAALDEADALLMGGEEADETGESAAAPVESVAGESTTPKFEDYVKIHGDFNFKVATGAAWKDFLVDMTGDKFLNSGAEASNLSLDGSLSFSVRPKDDFRIYGKTTVHLPLGLDATAANADNYDAFLKALAKGDGSADAAKAATNPYGFNPTSTTTSVPNLKIWELFSDFNLADTVYFRVGKQMVKWGTYVYQFWSPADIIALTSIDVKNRGVDREGPVAIKASFPFGLNLIEAYIVTPSDGQLTTIKDVKLAGRAQFVLLGWEMGIGGSYQQDEDVKATATVNGAIGPVSVFGEAYYHWKTVGVALEKKAYSSNYQYMGIAGNAIQTESYDYTVVNERTGGFFEGTVGASYNNPDIYLTVMGQYYFNGAGYSNAGSMAADMVKYYVNGATANFAAPLTVPYTGTALTTSDLMSIGMGNTGMHYVALNVSESFVKDSHLTVTGTWIGNLSDGSGMLMPSVSVKINDWINLGLNAGFNYGPPNSQYVGLAQAFKDYHSDNPIYGQLQNGYASGVGSIFDQSKFSLGMSLSLGSGEF